MKILDKLTDHRSRKQQGRESYLREAQVLDLPRQLSQRYEYLPGLSVVPTETELAHLAQRYLSQGVDGGKDLAQAPARMSAVETRDIGRLTLFEHEMLHDWISLTGDGTSPMVQQATTLAGKYMQEDMFQDFLDHVRYQDDNPLIGQPDKLTERPVSEFEREQVRTSAASFDGTDYAWPNITDDELDGLVLETRMLDRVQANELMHRTHVLGERIGRRAAITAEAWFGNSCNERSIPGQDIGMTL